MATYAEMAPIIEGAGIGQGAVDNYFETLPADPVPEPDPTITQQKIVEVADAYLVVGIEASNGIGGIAKTTGLLREQVKAIIDELVVLKAYWDSINNPPPEL